MIDRINLIEKEPFRFTYGKLAAFMGATAGLLVILLVSQTLRTVWYEKKITLYQGEIDQIRKKQEVLVKKEPPKLEKGPQGKLKSTFGRPPWSELIGEIVGPMPGTVWLTSLKIVSPEVKEDKKEKEEDSRKKKAQSEKTEGKPLTLKGAARRPADVASFLSQLWGLPSISKAVLTFSKMEDQGFTFTIECDLAGR